MEPRTSSLDAFEAGFVLGLLVGEGHFGGDGRQPQVTLKMHVRHLPLFEWLKKRFRYAKLYGPYEHDGRRYYQMMWRGTALRYGLLTWLQATPWSEIDPHTFARFSAMMQRYGISDVPAQIVPGLRDKSGLSARLKAQRPLDGDAVPPGEASGG